MLAEPIRPPLTNSTSSQHKQYFAYRFRSLFEPYRDKALYPRSPVASVLSVPAPGTTPSTKVVMPCAIPTKVATQWPARAPKAVMARKPSDLLRRIRRKKRTRGSKTRGALQL